MAEKNFRTKEISKKKIATVSELSKLIKESNSIVMVSVKDVPASQYQQIKKKLRGEAEIKVVKKNIMLKSMDSVDKEAMKKFKSYLKEDVALIFSKLDAFEISMKLSKSKSSARAKVGQIVPEDIVVEPGATELVPGPVVSELGALGIKFSIEDGKINIREKKVILKAGQAVTDAAASIMSKLDMKPILVGLEPFVAYDSREGKIYEDIKIDQEKAIDELKHSAGKALAFAVKLAYACKDSIRFLLAKASAEEKCLSKMIKQDNIQEEK